MNTETETETATYIVDYDTLSVILDEDDDGRYESRDAVDAIADAVEAELERRGITAEVERIYATSGRRSHEDDPQVWDTVLVKGVDDLRAAILD